MASTIDAEWSEHLDGFSSYQSHDLNPESQGSLLVIFWDMFEVPILLSIIGSSSAVVSYALSVIITFGSDFRYSLITDAVISDHSSQLYSMFLYCSFCTLFALGSSFLTQNICREASGSGLPEIKTILSGTIKPSLLSLRLVVAKFSGLALAMIAGLSVGKEGPLVQISGAIADTLMKLSIFQHVRKQDAKRLEIIACACGSGVAATFGTSFGSILFSIELTSSAYLVRTLPRAFLSSVCAMIVFYSFGVSDQLALFNEEILSTKVTPNWIEFVAFIWIGLLCGLLGVVFVSFVELLSKMRNRLLDPSKYSRALIGRRSYIMVGVVSLLASIPLYYEYSGIASYNAGGKNNASTSTSMLSRADKRTILDFLFQKNEFPDIVDTLNLLPYFVYKFIATAFSVTLPLPVGLFTPIFQTGGVFGRIIGEKLCSQSAFVNYLPWEYSLLGAAGLATGVTRALSTAVIVYELAGQPHLRLPLSVVVLTSYFVGNRFSKMVYEVLIDTNGTPFMQEIPKSLYNIPVAQVMIPIGQDHVLALDSTYEDAERLLNAMNLIEREPPIQKDTLVDLSSFSEDTAPQTPRSAHKKASHTLQGSLSVEQPKYRAKTRSPIQSQSNSTLRPYSPLVIPIVKSKESMVIVGALLTADLVSSLDKLYRMIEFSETTPVILGEYETGSFPDHDEKRHHRVDDGLRSLMKETLQFVIISNGGRQMAPVNRDSSKAATLRVVLLEAFIPIDTSPYQVVDSMQLIKVELLFRMLSLNQAYVTNSGRLVGIVTRSSLREFLGKYQKRPFDRCVQLFTALSDLISKRRAGYEELPEQDVL